jgi:hypothetical protein
MTFYTVTEIEKGKVRPWSRAYRSAALAKRAVGSEKWQPTDDGKAMITHVGDTAYIVKRTTI